MASDDARRAVDLITTIVEACPRRRCATESELRAQELLRDRFAVAGAETELQPFRWNTNLFAVLALHFGLATVASALAWWVDPRLAAALHALVAVSYFGDSTRRYYWLRRLFPFRPSQNLVARLPAVGTPRRRIVLVGHSDAAFTGWLFHPAVIRAGTRPPPIPGLGFMRQSLLVVTASCVVLVGIDVALSLELLDGRLALALLVAATIPSIIAFILNAQMVLNDTIVPGANDNLTGCAGAWITCERLVADKPDDVELVFVCTGAEEAGTGGAYCLARDCEWGVDETVVLAIDGLTNGDLRLFVDGEIVESPPPDWLLAACEATRLDDPRFASVTPFRIPSGASDAMPFLARRFASVGIGCVDPAIGAPRHYHWPTDTPDNLDVAQLAVSLDFVEALVRRLWRANA